ILSTSTSPTKARGSSPIRLDRRQPRRSSNFPAWPLPHLFDVPLRVELPSRACARHVTNLAEHRPFAPRPVELAHHRPGNPRVSVRIAPVELIFVIQINRPLDGGLPIRSPLQNLFRPVHAHYVVHPSMPNHLR